MTFGNGSGWQEGEKPKAALAVRMLHSYFSENRAFTDFLGQLTDFMGVQQVERLTIRKACRLIRSDMLARGNMDPLDNLVLVLGVDEVDKVLIDVAGVEERRVNLTPLIRSLGEAMCGVEVDASSSTFICPLIAGIVVGDVTEVVSQSSHSIVRLDPTPLNETEVANILASRGWVPEILQNPELKRCLADLGGVPLILEAFVREVEAEHLNFGSRIVQLPYGSLRDRTVNYMLQRVNTAFKEQTLNLKELLFRVIWNRSFFYLSDSFGDVTVDDLQRSGILSLGADERIRVPIIYLVRKDPAPS